MLNKLNKFFKYIIFCIFLVMSFSISVFGITQNKDKIYEIKTKEDLYEFAKIVNSGESSASAKLMNDIIVNPGVMDEKTDSKNVLHWECIGNNEKRPFLGVFDGCGHTISGLYADVVSKDIFNANINFPDSPSFLKYSHDCIGLFGIVGDVKPIIEFSKSLEEFDLTKHKLQSNNGVIKNLKVINSYFKNNENNLVFTIGGICSINTGVLENCYCENTTNITLGVQYISENSGICGRNYGYINNCYCKQIRISSSGKASQANESGGICVSNYGAVNNSYVESAGIISADGWSNLSGGICSHNNGKIINSYCYLSRVISQLKEKDPIYFDSNKSSGICAHNSGIIKNCYSSSVEANSIASCGSNSSGGICGDNFGTISNCYSTASNINAIGGDENHKGGICGAQERGTETRCAISNCYYLKDNLVNTDLFGIGAINETFDEYIGDRNYKTQTSDIETQTKAVSAKEFKNGFVLNKLNSSGPCEGYEFKQNTAQDVDKTLKYLIINKK